LRIGLPTKKRDEAFRPGDARRSVGAKRRGELRRMEPAARVRCERTRARRVSVGGTRHCANQIVTGEALRLE